MKTIRVIPIYSRPNEWLYTLVLDEVRFILTAEEFRILREAVLDADVEVA